MTIIQKSHYSDDTKINRLTCQQGLNM